MPAGEAPVFELDVVLHRGVAGPAHRAIACTLSASDFEMRLSFQGATWGNRFEAVSAYPRLVQSHSAELDTR